MLCLVVLGCMKLILNHLHIINASLIHYEEEKERSRLIKTRPLELKLTYVA